MVLYSSSDTLGVVHFIGIGGIGMSGIAEILYHLGYRVQGSDIRNNNNIERLRDFGIKIFIGHNENNIDSADYIVISSAVSEDNVEIIEAHRRKIRILKRSEMLAELTRFKYSIAVSGSHGKTTTTSMIGHMFEYLNLNPTLITGGILNSKDTNAYLGSSNYLIVEADESDGTFIEILSNIAVVTNIDKEHLSYYKNFANLKDAFKKFITKIPFYGFAVVCYDDPIVKELVDQIENRRIIKYGIDSNDLNIMAFNIKSTELSSSFDVEVNFPWSKKFFTIKDIQISIPGTHNILNSLAAISIGIEKNFELNHLKKSLSKFEGVNRRFTKLGEYKEALIIDDYAHHPKEIQATLQTAKLFANSRNGRIIAIFQPHRYSRLFDLFEEFSNCFEGASKIFISNIYEAGESNIYNIDHISLVNSINLLNHQSDFACPFTYSEKELCNILDSEIKPGDIVVFMGAGSITNWSKLLFTKK
jgi:UDP-N-acetylmuramate--alanine ligase